MKKLIAFALALALTLSLVVVLAGCGGSLGNFEIPADGYDGSKVTIKFYHTMGADYREILDKYIVEFNKLYPNITVKHDQVGGYDDVRNQIKTELTGDDYPNLAYCYPDHVALYNQFGTVVTLDDLIDSKIEVKRDDKTTEPLGFTAEQKADFVEVFWNEGKQYEDGMMYTLPFAKSTEVLYYNKDKFAEWELEVPDHWLSTGANDTTSMEYVCAQLKLRDPDCVPFGYDSESNWFITLMEQAELPYTSLNGNHYQFNTPEAQALMTTLREWYQKGYFTTGTLYNTGSASGYTSNLFKGKDATKQSYMSIGSSAGAGNQRPDIDTATNEYPFEVGITTIPQMDPSSAVAISQGPNICIFNRKNPQEVVASWLFVKFLLTNRSFQYEFTEHGGYVPPIKSLSDPAYIEDPAVALYIENMELADGGEYISYLSQKVCLGLAEGKNYDRFFTSPAFPGSSTARDQVGRLLVACVSQQGTAAEVITAAFNAAINECEFGG